MTVGTQGAGPYASGYQAQQLGTYRVEGGVKFRVWLPFAIDVKVVLYDDNHNESCYQMNHEGNDCWSTVVSQAKNGQQYLYRVDGKDKSDPRAQAMVHSAGNSLIYLDDFDWKVNDFQMAPWNELVIYQMHCGSYPDKTPQKEYLIKGIIDDLFYLQKLGVNVIQLLPTCEFPGDLSFGYNPAALYAVESHYGGPTALKQLVDAAHARGIAVFLDVVYNHLSPDYSHPGGDKSIWQMTSWHQELENGEQGGGVYFYNNWQAYTPWGSRPDYRRQEVRELLRDNVMMWLLEYRIDGLRFDSVANIRNVYGNDWPLKPAYDLPEGRQLIQDINNNVKREHERRNILTIAEDLKNEPWITEDDGGGFGSQWDSSFMDPSREVLIKAKDEERDMFVMREILYQRYGADAFHRIVTNETHDAASALGSKRRLTDCIAPGQVDDSWYVKKRIGLGAAMVMSAPGIPMMLQGQELLEWRQFGDDRAKYGVDWNRFCDIENDCRSCLNSRLKCLSATGDPCQRSISCSDCPELPERCDPQGRFKGIFYLYRDLIRLRRNWSNNARGLCGQQINVFHLNNTDKVIAYHRWEAGGAGDDVIVILNFANRSYDGYTLGFPRGGQWQVRFNSDWNGYDPSFGNFYSCGTDATPGNMDGLSFQGNIGIAPYTALVLSQ